MSEERIEWCDVYKGLLMILVVIGHATGMFNKYIYQFHVAAFFVISGYTSDFLKKSFSGLFVEKFYRLMFPFYIFGIGGNVTFSILKRAEVLNKVSTINYTGTLWQAIVDLFTKMAVQCDWLRALWFLPVLFIANLMIKVIQRIAQNRCGWMAAMSLLIFAVSERNTIKGNTFLILAGIAQLFFLMGLLLRKVLGKYEKKEIPAKYLTGMSMVCFFIWVLCSNTFLDYTVDWFSRRFNGIIIDIILPIFGIAITYLCARFLSQYAFTNKVFSYIGKNTMGIMILQFVGFKIAYVLLILCHGMEHDELRLLTPTAESGNYYWIIITLISVGCSLVMWKMINKIPTCCFLLGNSRIAVEKWSGNGVMNTIRFFSDIFEEMRKKIDRKVYLCVFAVAATGLLVVSAKDISRVINCQENVSITFPYTGSEAEFGDGWLTQGEHENYRWVRNRSELNVFLGTQQELHIEGYIPDNVEDMRKIKISINGDIVLEQGVGSGEALSFDISIPESIRKYAVNRITIEFDGSRIPLETDKDQRIFSALINAIEIRGEG